MVALLQLGTTSHRADTPNRVPQVACSQVFRQMHARGLSHPHLTLLFSELRTPNVILKFICFLSHSLIGKEYNFRSSKISIKTVGICREMIIKHLKRSLFDSQWPGNMNDASQGNSATRTSCPAMFYTAKQFRNVLTL